MNEQLLFGVNMRKLQTKRPTFGHCVDYRKVPWVSTVIFSDGMCITLKFWVIIYYIWTRDIISGHEHWSCFIVQIQSFNRPAKFGKSGGSLNALVTQNLFWYNAYIPYMYYTKCEITGSAWMWYMNSWNCWALYLWWLRYLPFMSWPF